MMFNVNRVIGLTIGAIVLYGLLAAVLKYFFGIQLWDPFELLRSNGPPAAGLRWRDAVALAAL